MISQLTQWGTTISCEKNLRHQLVSPERYRWKDIWNSLQPKVLTLSSIVLKLPSQVKYLARQAKCYHFREAIPSLFQYSTFNLIPET